MVALADAFHATDFALPRVNIQPEGDVTLVTLPTYFEVDWPTEGYEPEEVDTLDPGRFLGLDIAVKPTLESVIYSFGDGTTFGPTTSLGGPYPAGDITKTYETAGAYDVRPDVVYKGWVSIDGSSWIDIPGEVDLTGEPTTLTVKTANNRLYTPAG